MWYDMTWYEKKHESTTAQYYGKRRKCRKSSFDKQ